MSHPKQQHYVPQCYLREFVDLNTPPNQEPYVWIFGRGERKGRKKAPPNIFTETDLYTIKLKTGEQSYAIEATLSNIESRYADIYRTKIKYHLPLNEDEHIILCAFVSIMLQRTLRQKDNLEHFFNELIEGTERIERAHNVEPRQSQGLRRLKEDTHKLGVVQLLPDIVDLLMNMNVAFLVADKGAKFVTSDDPCNLFNPDLQWQRFCGLGLAQKKIQVTLPLSPKILLCMSWSNLRGYIFWKKSRVQENNRMVVGSCYKYFVSDCPKPKRTWFRRYPLNVLFMLKVLKHKVAQRTHKDISPHRF